MSKFTFNQPLLMAKSNGNSYQQDHAVSLKLIPSFKCVYHQMQNNLQQLDCCTSSSYRYLDIIGSRLDTLNLSEDFLRE